MSRRSSSRSGAALIIALVILAALLMLGLPFLFTQSASLTGTRSFATNQQAHLSGDAAENSGIDVVGTAMGFHYAYTAANPALVEEYTSLYWSLRGGEYDKLPHFDPASQTGAAAMAPSPNHVHIDLRQIGQVNTAGALDPVHNPTFPDLIQPGQAPGTTPPPIGAVSTLGLAVEDEAGKLDPNYLDALDWMSLFAAEQINDVAVVTGQQGPGALAQALAQLHNPPNSAYPGLGRITYLEQLLSAVPVAGTRLGLTHTELELLRPLLSISTRAMGRAGPRLPDVNVNASAGTAAPYILSGPLMPGTTPANPVAADALTLIDLGTLLNVSGSSLFFDSLPPVRMLANPVTPTLVGSGTTLVVEDKSASDANGNPLQIEHVISYTQASLASAAIAADMPVAIAAPPAVNALQIVPAVQQLFSGYTTISPLPATMATPAPNSMGGTSGLASGAFLYTLPAIPPLTLSAQQNAFALVNPLATTVVLGTGTALPTTAADVTLLSTAPTLAGNGQTYAAAPDQNNQQRPVLLAGAPVIHVQVSTLTALPPSGWAVLSGGQRGDATGIQAIPEIVYYSSLSIDNAGSGLGTLTVWNYRGMTWGNVTSAAITLFCDPNPKLAGVPPSPTVSVTFFSPHELPPLQVASHGVVTVESSATILDPSGRQVAQRSRRVAAQAVPQEALLEERWLTQGQLHALLASRQGSLMTSFPRPFPRLSDIMPNDGDPAATSGNPDLDVGMRPATLRTLMTSAFVTSNQTWMLPLSGTSQTFLTAGLSAASNTNQIATGIPVASTSIQTNTHTVALGATPQSIVTPEGLVCTAQSTGVYLSFPVQAPDGGPFGLSGAVGVAPTPTLNTELPARQIAFWIKPTQPWTGVVPLLEMRMPVLNTGLPFNGTLNATLVTAGASSLAPLFDGRFAQGGVPPAAPDTSLQNFLSLSYDGSTSGQEQLVLRFANGAIEHKVTYGGSMLIAPYDPTQPHLDTRSQSWTHPPTGQTGIGAALGAARPFNDIEYRYLYPLEPDCWHLVQVSYLNDTPGAQAITVDGLAGRDIIRSGALTMSLPGDHLTLPALVLDTTILAAPSPSSLSAISASLTGASSPLTQYSQITVSCWVPADPAQPGVTLGADALLPASGYIRIGDEYLSYQSISATTVSGGIASNILNGVVRAQRQYTVAGTNPLIAWPTMPAHNPGDLVVPGGYRILGGCGTLLSGGCTLAPLVPSASSPSPGFWQGDSANAYLLWGIVDGSIIGDDTTPDGPSASPMPLTITVNNMVIQELYAAPQRLNMSPITGSAASPDPWPIRGFAKLVNVSGATTPASLLNTMVNTIGAVFWYDNTDYGKPPGYGQPFLNVNTALYPAGTAGSWQNVLPPGAPIQLPTGTAAYAVVMLSCEIDCSLTAPLTNLILPAAAGGTAGNYLAGSGTLTAAGPPSTALIQFYDQIGSGANIGDVEWMNYHWLTPSPGPLGSPTGTVATIPALSTTGQYYLVNFYGFPWTAPGTVGAPANQRGMQRTHGPLDPSGVVEVYPTGTRVLPVQTLQAGGLGVVATGDVVTIAPTVRASGAPTTYAYSGGTLNALNTPAAGWQAVVRYAPVDGFSDVPGTAGSPTAIPPIPGVPETLGDDTNNQYFAFTEALPTSFASATYDLLCWPCWNGNDLSPLAWNGGAAPATPSLITNVAGLMPWNNVFATGFLQPGTTDDRVTYIGASDDRTPLRNPNPVVVMEGEIDALQGGLLPLNQGVTASSTSASNVVASFTAASGTVTATDGPPWSGDPTAGTPLAQPSAPWLTATATLTASSPLTILASTPAAFTATGFGLVQIGGEIFPYRQSVNAAGAEITSMDLIGRGLLGSTPCVHSGPEPMLFLPIGPIALLGAPLAQSYEGALQLATSPGTLPPTPPQFQLIDAPALLICSTDGQNMELIAAPDGWTAPWLRGLYGSCPPEFATTAGSPWNGALVIPWWPRYPSALPGASTQQWTKLTAVQQAAMLRSRTYAWASFPLRFYDAWFSTADDLGYVTLLDDAKVQYLSQLPNYGNPTFDVFARALASGFDWVHIDNSATPPLVPEIPFGPSVAGSGSAQPAGVPIAAAFATAQFAPGGAVTNVDGAELRVLWRYHAPSTTTAINLFEQASLCNRAPTIGQAKLRCRAPAKIVRVESAR